jgi:hypothetical protein
MTLAPPSAEAIQLRWASGGNPLALSEAVRCTLVVQADDIETSLPLQWRLLCVSDTTGVAQVPISGPDSCGLGIAHPASLAPPHHALETMTNRSTLSMCSQGAGRVYVGWHIVNIPAGARGKFKVVAIDRTDPTGSRVLQSPEVTFNDGITAPFAPAILNVTTEHLSTEYRLRVVGAGLGSVVGAKLVAADTSWEVPLSVSSMSDTLLTAAAELASWVPDCWLVLRSSSGAVDAEHISADPPPPPLGSQAACQARFIEDIYPPAMIQPKDFALVPGGWSPNGSWTFHLFYIRQNQAIKAISGSGATEKNLGHAVSNDLASWTVLDTAAIRVRPGRWDSFHVWAPTIIRRGIRYHMFYTGVDAAGNQSIGQATSLDLVHWEQGDSILTGSNAGSWVEPVPQDYGNQRQLRDPFVMEDPATPDQWLLYFTAVTNVYPGMAVGFVRMPGNSFTYNAVQQGGALWRSQQNRSSRLESPHVFQRAGKWWLLFTKPVLSQDTIYAFSTTASPTDTVTSQWSPVRSIRDLVPLSEATAYTFWHGTEYLRLAGTGAGNEYLAGFNDSDQSISYTQMQNAQAPYLFTGGCPSALDVGPEGERLHPPGIRLLRGASGQQRLDLEVTLTEPQDVVVAVHDLMGRRIRILARGRYPAGRTALLWDGADGSGHRLQSGIYFATLSDASSRSSVRAVFLR